MNEQLWKLVSGRPQIDPNELAAAVENELSREPLDYRTRLLVHESAEALREYWGKNYFQKWLNQSPRRDKIEKIAEESFSEIGFPSLRTRIMEKTDPQNIEGYFRELGIKLDRPVRVYVGGSASLILKKYFSRHTEDIDVVDEVPAEIRPLHKELDQLEKRYGLHLAHFQSHYLPMGWENRVHSLEPFGKLQVYLVDVYDIFLSKLFSGREKDRDDLRVLVSQLDKDTIIRKLKDNTTELQSEEKLKKYAETNWFILFGEDLPQ